ncbi:dolichyl-phosphate-mannose-protein mannosyltransferase [Candidatus Magnetobacterium bavaricum]|uniref:Dolichyl-phosphate-mannose-protein mannosyltransferase n=1 Tax=Candidatus Magnetobacterium bavaricum TaxID=29290 RepID=A0A0F3GJU7_9BACT|nr:dolichyl-phosphate-mannose-protein mannosyltransferase [Candidatus Magnetobacterium bavaricum]
MLLRKLNIERTLIAVLLSLSVLRVLYVLYGPLDLSADEALYWDCTRRLELSYYSKGPLIVYLMYASTSMFGTNVFAIRIMAVIIYFFSSIFLYKLVTALYGSESAYPEGSNEDRPCYSDPRLIALACALIFQVVPLFATYAIVFTIDSPFVFFWILALYLLWRAITQTGYGNWVLLGVAIGLGMQAKYIMAMFIPCAFAFILLTRYRPLLRSWKPYVAFVVSMLTFSPVIIWNMQHNWVTLRHTAGHAHVSDGLRIVPGSFLEFIGAQAGVVTPVVFVLLFVALFRLRGDGSRGQGDFLFYFSVPVFGFFLAKSAQGKVQANWAMTAYITGLIAFVRYFFYAETREALRITGVHTKRTIVIGIIVAILLTVVGLFPQAVGLPLKLDPTARLRGWQGLGTEVGRLHDELSKAGHVLILSDKYQITSALAFYVKGNPITYSVNLGRRMNEYDMWPDINKAAEVIRQNAANPINGLFVTDGDTTLNTIVSAAFDRCDKQLLDINENGRLLRKYSIFKCRGFKGLHDKTPHTY